MIKLRNSVKAIIMQNNKLLFNRMENQSSGEVFYILPGGGQEPGETFPETLHRECLEELGAKVNVKEMVLVREYIGQNHEFAAHDSDIHQIEYMFMCDLVTEVDLSKVVQLDYQQVGHQWIDIDKLDEWDVFPKILKKVFDNAGHVISDLYLGDVN